MPPTSLRLLLSGLLVGAAGAWLWTHFNFPTPPPSPPASSFVLPAWDWRTSPTPPLLPESALPALIATWLDLRDPSSPTADFALRADTLRALLPRLTAPDYPTLLAALHGHRPPTDRRLLRIASERFAELYPTQALAWAKSAPPAPHFDPLALTTLALQSWARQDPAAAAEWLATVSDPAHIAPLTTAILAEIAKTQPASAIIQFGPLLWDDGTGFDSLRPALLAWIERDPTVALAWLIAQPDPLRQRLRWISSLAQSDHARALFNAILSEPNLQADREPAMRLALHHWSRAQPDEVLAWIRAIPERHRRHDMLTRLSEVLYPEAPANALPFALALPPSAARRAQLETILSTWAKRDPAASLAWIAAHPDPDVTAAASAATAAILATIARDEPTTALAEWETLRDPHAKAAALPAILEAWIAQDPAAARVWFETHRATLPAAQRASLRTLFSPSP